MFVANAISMLLAGLLFVPLIIAFYLKRTGPALITLEMLFVTFTVELLKPLFDSPRPPEARACDMFCTGPAVGGKPGFPSGHMATTAVFATSIALLFPTPPVITGAVALVTAMGWSRYVKKCHTLTQILGGTLYGFTIAILFKRFL